jgi:NADPH-dependent curcumin reductase CurA
MPKASERLTKWFKEGTLTADESETVIESGFDGIPNVWGKLFEGGNKGKLVTKLV